MCAIRISLGLWQTGAYRYFTIPIHCEIGEPNERFERYSKPWRLALPRKSHQRGFRCLRRRLIWFLCLGAEGGAGLLQSATRLLGSHPLPGCRARHAASVANVLWLAHVGRRIVVVSATFADLATELTYRLIGVEWLGGLYVTY